MAEPRPSGWLARFQALPDEAPAKVLALAFAVALVCAVLVSTTAVLLRPRQEANQRAERLAGITEMIAALPGYGAAKATVEPVVVELASGRVASAIDPYKFDPRAAANDAATSVALPAAADAAHIGRRANDALVYLVRRGGKLALVILPVYGVGYTSTLYGYLALEPDGETVVGLKFYAQQETPGLGGKIDDPAWRAQWPGKKLRDDEGALRIGVAKGKAGPDEAPYQVDGISGATRTGRGVTNLLRFWLGREGFGPFLERLKSGESGL